MDINKKLDIDKLIKLVTENKKELFKKDVTAELDEASRFALALNLKNGKNKIYSTVIYKAYTLWSPAPLTRISFLQHFNKIFHKYDLEKQGFYLMNYKPANLLREAAKLKSIYE